MQIIHPLADMTGWSNEVIASGKTLALVPTMGYFHEGHLSLMRLAGRMADQVVVSLFVNSLQFGPSEDFSRYPRDLERDARMAENEKVDILFVPTDKDMYSPDFNTRVRVDGITDTLCGKQRPGHFEGCDHRGCKAVQHHQAALRCFWPEGFPAVKCHPQNGQGSELGY